MSSSDVEKFRSEVWKYYKKNGRHGLPWRQTSDPYRIMVSEVMLQQTQVSRVIEKYKEFLKAFPNVRALARASLSDVLRVWSGLGYNRRGKYLHDAAKTIVEKYKGKIPTMYSELVELPGMGPYTTSAIRVFAFNLPDVLIETNIRAVFIYHFFSHTYKVDDRTICVYASKVAHGQDPRGWHSALMDYGVHVKKLHKNPARKSTLYKRQSKFKGSLRQIRGAILSELHKSPSLLRTLPFEKERIKSALASLARDRLITKQEKMWRVA